MHWPSCTPSPALPYIRSACEQSLKDLGLSHLDLYLMHWPEAWVPGTEGLPEAPQPDTATTIEQTWWVHLCWDGDGAGLASELNHGNIKPSQADRSAALLPVHNMWALPPPPCRSAMEALVDAGLVRAIGISNGHSRPLLNPQVSDGGAG